MKILGTIKSKTVLTIVMSMLFLSILPLKVSAPEFPSYKGYCWGEGYLLRNGGFEYESLYEVPSPWITGGPGDHRVTDEDRFSGSHSILIGFKYSANVANMRDWCYETITIPATVTNVYLSFYYHLFTEDCKPYNWFEVYVRDSSGNNLALVFEKAGVDFPGLEEYGWAQVTYNLAAYAGQTIQLYFAVANMYDTSYKTWCYIDDVWLIFPRVTSQARAVGDDVWEWVTLPWTFTYFGESKSRVAVCSNGFLLFDPTDPSQYGWRYFNTPEELQTKCMIAAFWDDLRTDQAGGLVSTPGVYVDSYSNYVVITWEATRFGDASDSVKFQVVLFRDGNIRIAMNGATNLADFTPTIGVSKRDKAGYYLIADRRYTSDPMPPRLFSWQTWQFTYDCGCFMREHTGLVGHLIWTYQRRGACLMIPGGYVDHEDYGGCGCGPTTSRNYAPDYWHPYWGSNYLWSDIRWDVNQYSAAQSITGHSYSYCSEFRIATAYGSFNHFYSTLPNAEYYKHPDKDIWGGVETWEGEIYTRTPEQIVAGYYYFADAYFSMAKGTPIECTAYEYEMKIDHRSDCIPLTIHPGGYPLDWWKVYYASMYNTQPHGCGEPPTVLNITEFPSGFVVVENSPHNTILIRVASAIETTGSLAAYIDSRSTALTELVTESRSEDYIPLTITFNEPLSPRNYIKFCETFKLEVAYSRFSSMEGSGIFTVKDPKEPFRWDFAKALLENRGDKIVGVTAVAGLIKAKFVNSLLLDPRVLLVDPARDLTVQQFFEFYEALGEEVIVEYPDDIWVEYGLNG